MSFTSLWDQSPVETDIGAVMHEPVKLTLRGELGDGWVAALRFL